MPLVQIVQGMLDSNAITASNIADGAVTGNKIAPGAVTSSAVNFNNLLVNGDLTVTGNLTASGTITYLDTSVTVTSALSVINVGTGPALVVRQKGNESVAEFYDQESGSALQIANNGQIGIGTNTPSTALHVIGNTTVSGSLTAITLSASRTLS